MSNTITLRKRGFHKPESLYKQYFIAIFMVAIFSAILIFINLAYGKEFLIQFFQHMYSKMPWELSLLLATPVIYPIIEWKFRNWMYNSCFKISPFSIKFKNGFPDIFHKFMPEWEIYWHDIEKVSFANILANPLLTRLVIETPQGKQRLLPFQWIDPENQDEISLFPKKIILKQKKLNDIISQNTLIKLFSHHNLITQNTEPPKTHYEYWNDINSHPVAQGIMGVVLLATFYFIIDTFFYHRKSILIHRLIQVSLS